MQACYGLLGSLGRYFIEFRSLLFFQPVKWISHIPHFDLFEQLKLVHSQNESVRMVVNETLARIQANMISMLLLGSCGKLSYASLGGAAHLIRSVVSSIPLTEELRSSAVGALKNEQFRLGDDARHVVLNALEGVVRNKITVEGLTRLLEQIWELHQLDEVESLETSDAVVRVIKRFSQ